MAAINTSTIVAGIRHPGSTIVGQIAGAIRAAWSRGKARRDYRHILECDEHLLHDIGLTRGDVWKAIDELDRIR